MPVSVLSDLHLFMPELTMAVLTIALLMTGVAFKRNVTQVISLAAVFVLLFALSMVMRPGESGVAFGGMVLSNSFTEFVKGMLLAGGILVMILSSEWLEKPEHNQFEFPVLMLFTLLGLMLMVSANNLMSVYMALELASLSQYVLAAFQRDSVRSTEAGLKYFVLGALASGLMLFGMSLVYGFAGGTGFQQISQLLTQNPAEISPGLVVGLVLVLVGFCFKISAVPFHMWTPDVYEGAPTPVTAFFAIAPKIAGLALFLRVLAEPFGALEEQWRLIIIAVSVTSMIVGAFGALTQTNIKRLLAYSSIGHVGYALMGIAAGSVDGTQGLLVYLALYLVMSAGAFGCVLLMRRNGEYVEEISELAGLSKNQPLLAFTFAVFMFSMAGIPPLAGFFGKMYVFLAAVQQGLIVLAVVGVLSSVVACFYYLKIVKLMYFDEAGEPFDRNVAMSTHYTLAFCTIFNLGFIFYPTVLVQFARRAAEALPL